MRVATPAMSVAPAHASPSSSESESQSGVTPRLPVGKRFVFHSSGGAPSLEIFVPEILQASYSFYVWPCAPVLAWFLWTQRNAIAGSRILEIGSGTALPGILAAKCGAIVTLTDSCTRPKSLAHIAHCCRTNGLTPGIDVQISGLTWGSFSKSSLEIGPFDLVIASDCFYDPAIFEDIIVSVSYFLERDGARFIFTYQERSSDWSIEALLKKWNLKAHSIDLVSLGEIHDVNFTELMRDHSIHLLEIVRS